MIFLTKVLHGLGVKVGACSEQKEILAILADLFMSTKQPGDPLQWMLDWPDFVEFRERIAHLDIDRDGTDDAINFVQKMDEEDRRIADIKEAREFVQPSTDYLKTKLFHEQLAGVSFLLRQGNACLADEMGVGKTIQVLTAASNLRDKGPLLVVCPNTVKYGWQKEVVKHTRLTSLVLGNSAADIKDDLLILHSTNPDVVIVHYDALRAKKGDTISALVKELLKIPFGVIAIDEAHRVKNPESKQAQACQQLVLGLRNKQREKARVWAITGTPVSETPTDAWSILKLLGTPVPSYDRFYKKFFREVEIQMGMRTVREVVGYKNLGLLKGRLQRHMIRRLKSDMTGFPDKMVQVRNLTLSGDQLAAYKQVKEGVISDINGSADKLTDLEVAVKIIRLRQILNHPGLLDFAGDSVKYAEVDAILEEVLSDPLQKVVIWTEYRDAVTLLAERYRKKYGTVTLMGGTSNEELHRLAHNWDTCQERVAIGIPAYGGTGIDWLSRCRTAIYIDVPYSVILLRQSVDRIHRRVVLSSDPTPIERLKASPASIIYLNVDRTVDDLVWDKIVEKSDVADALSISDEKLRDLGKDELLRYLK